MLWRRFAPAWLLGAALLTACVSEVPPPGTVFVDTAPPAPRVEVVGRPPSRNHAWIAGHWTWTGDRYVWVDGRWELRPHPHAAWVPGHWVLHRGRWYWREGRWK